MTLKIAFLGATRGMGRALSRQLAERGDALCLLGRNMNDLSRSATDLTARGAGCDVACMLCDLEALQSFEAVLSAAAAAMGGLDTVVVTAAMFATQEQLEADPMLAERLLRVNFTNTVLFCEAARKVLLAAGGGTLCVFSSVAGDRGRKPIVIYGAAKAGLSRYLEALDHKHHAEGLKVITVKPGFVRTGMTEGLSPPPFAGEPEQVGRTVLAAIDRGTPVVYAPAPWRLIMAVIRALPRFIMRRVGF